MAELEVIAEKVMAEQHKEFKKSMNKSLMWLAIVAAVVSAIVAVPAIMDEVKYRKAQKHIKEQSKKPA